MKLKRLIQLSILIQSDFKETASSKRSLLFFKSMNILFVNCYLHFYRIYFANSQTPSMAHIKRVNEQAGHQVIALPGFLN
jgi:hypothetical protein